jgi:hypothetical protein
MGTRSEDGISFSLSCAANRGVAYFGPAKVVGCSTAIYKQMERHHYLGRHLPFGADLRYWVRDRHRELACLLWTSPAWKMQARDAWVGWSNQQWQRNLKSIVNNGRFLILPWARIQGLASKILALSARQMPQEWETRSGHCPLLLETLVDAARFRGTCYRAANWLHVGQTAGRGRMDREHKTTTPDRPPVVGTHPSHLRDDEYVRLGTVSLLAGLDLHSGRVAEDRQRHAQQ